MSFRYQPYGIRPKPLPELNHRSAGGHRLAAAYQILRQRNHDEGILLSWSHGVLNDWEEITRYFFLLFFRVIPTTL